MKNYITNEQIDNALLECSELIQKYNYLESQINKKLRLKNGALAPVLSSRYSSYYKNNKILIDDIIQTTSFIQEDAVSFKERVYCIENKITLPKLCLNCGKPTKFIGFTYQECCSASCAGELKTGKYSGVNNPSRIESYNRLHNLIGTNLITPIENYIDRTKPITVSCQVCEVHYISTMVREVNKKSPACCNSCGINTSQPVIDICKYLDANNITYTTEHRFKGCINPKTKYSLPFDIYLPESDVIIEYDGPTHTIPIYGEENLEDIRYRDDIKNKWCKDNNKVLLRIPYTIHNHVSYTHNFLQTLSPKNIIYSNTEYNNDIIELRDYIESFGYDDYIIFGVYRGSLQPAVHLSNVTNSRKNIGIIQFQSYDGNDKTAKIITSENISQSTSIFVIDDIYDTGNTISKVKKLMKYKYKKQNVHYITIFGKPNDENVYYLRENKSYVIFPWEQITDSRCKSCNFSEPCRNDTENMSHCNLEDKSFSNSHTCEEFIERYE